ncbi:MAG: hypothetical protein K5893_04995 [Prevotella sp.]|nr:hypothetical protein [Prevotella sp.]
MRRLFIITIVFVVAAIIACTGNGKPDFAAAHAAKEYYDMLSEERFEQFVDGMNYPNPIPASYREQLVANARMYVDEQRRAHKGLSEVRVVNCVNDSAQTSANAFLMLCFADSTIEQVVVPMVKRNGHWYMK